MSSEPSSADAGYYEVRLYRLCHLRPPQPDRTQELERIPHHYALVLATLYDVLKKARRASNRCSKDSQALGGHAIDCLETGEIERVRDLLNANAVI